MWKKSGALYDGDWENGERSGFGTLSARDDVGGMRKAYAGAWKHNKKHVRLHYIFICSV